MKQYRDTTHECSKYIYKLTKTEKTKIWKPDRFKFGKSKGGKGYGLASIT